MGLLSDKYGRKPLMLAGCAGFILLSYPAMMLMAKGDMLSAVLAMVMLGAFIAAFDGACSAAMAELFPTSVRYGGLSIAYSLRWLLRWDHAMVFRLAYHRNGR